MCAACTGRSWQKTQKPRSSPPPPMSPPRRFSLDSPPERSPQIGDHRALVLVLDVLSTCSIMTVLHSSTFPDVLAARVFQHASYGRTSPTMRHLLQRRSDELRRRLRQGPAGNATWSHTFATLAAHGIIAGPLGLQLAHENDLRGDNLSSMSDDMRAQKALSAALELLVFADARDSVSSAWRLPGNREWALRLWEADKRLLTLLRHVRSSDTSKSSRSSASAFSSTIAASSVATTASSTTAFSTFASATTASSTAASSSSVGQRLLERLQRDGFVRIDDFGLDVTALAAQARAALHFEGVASPSGDLLTARTRLPALEPLLLNTTIAHAIHGYLGGSARFDSYATFRLTPNATERTYPSGMWHHDRCGRRLRMFVFIHDVTTSTRPTLAARGSHRHLAYYSYLETLGLTRFSDALIRRSYDVVPLTGRAGGGFLLDTNGIHRAQLSAQLSGGAPRTAILLEWHPHRKIPSLAAHPAAVALPCPSVKAGAHPWRTGVSGYTLYPPDDLSLSQSHALGMVEGGAEKEADEKRKEKRGGGGRVWRRGDSTTDAQRYQRLRWQTRTQRQVPSHQQPMQQPRSWSHPVAAARAAAKASPMALHATKAAAALSRVSMREGSSRADHVANSFSRVVPPRTRPGELRDDVEAANACFSRASLDGCAAVWIVAPDSLPYDTLAFSRGLITRPQVQAAFVRMAAESAASLRRFLPNARTVLVLGQQQQQQQQQQQRHQLQQRQQASGAVGVSTPVANLTAPHASSPSRHHLAMFDHVLPWHDEPLLALASRHAPGHLGWLLKPRMLAAAAAHYGCIVFFDADTLIEHAAVASLFARMAQRGGGSGAVARAEGSSLLSDGLDQGGGFGEGGIDVLAAVEVPTSRSRTAMGGVPIFNSGVIGLRMNSPETQELLRLWAAKETTIACALPHKAITMPPEAPAGLERGQAWALATNDQFALARLVTPTWTHRRLRGLRVGILDSRFNYRGAHSALARNQSTGEAIEAPVIVRHDGRHKAEHLARVRAAWPIARRRAATTAHHTALATSGMLTDACSAAAAAAAIIRHHDTGS